VDRANGQRGVVSFRSGSGARRGLPRDNTPGCALHSGHSASLPPATSSADIRCPTSADVTPRCVRHARSSDQRIEPLVVLAPGGLKQLRRNRSWKP